jgi:ribokinase
VRVAVVGHVEWIDFVRVPSLPQPGDIVHADDAWAEPGGGGAVAAVQLSKLAGGATFFTALGDDLVGRRSSEELMAKGVQVEAAFRPAAQRRAITFIDGNGERTITVLGDRLGPHGADPLPWDELKRADTLYFTAGDDAALRLARNAKVLVATARVLPLLARAHVQLDALVGSSVDPAEQYRTGDLDPIPHLVVRTHGSDGGTYEVNGGATARYAPSPLPGPIVDTYGAGDSFAAGLTYALGAGKPPAEAVAFAARCGAAVVTGRGPYESQLRG